MDGVAGRAAPAAAVLSDVHEVEIAVAISKLRRDASLLFEDELLRVAVKAKSEVLDVECASEQVRGGLLQQVLMLRPMDCVTGGAVLGSHRAMPELRVLERALHRVNHAPIRRLLVLLMAGQADLSLIGSKEFGATRRVRFVAGEAALALHHSLMPDPGLTDRLHDLIVARQA